MVFVYKFIYAYCGVMPDKSSQTYIYIEQQ